MNRKISWKDRLLLVWKIPYFPVLLLTNFIVGLSMSFFAPYSSLFGIDEVKMSNIGFGIFMTMMSLGGIIISTYIGKLSDRQVSRKKILMITSGAAILGYLGFAFLRSYFLLSIVAFFLLGTGAATTPQLWAYAREILSKSNVPKNEAPYVMNVFRAFFALAWTVGPALAAWLLLMVGFKGLFSFVAFGFLLTLLAISFLLKDESTAAKKDIKERVVLRKFIFQPYILANMMAILLITASSSINMLNIPQFVTKVLHGTDMHVGIIFSVPPIFEVPFMFVFGILATKLDNALLIKMGFFIYFVYFCLISFVTAPWQIYPLQILSAAQVAIISGIAVTYFQDFIPNEPGTATTLYMSTQQVGSTVSYLLFGVLSQLLNYRDLFYICVAFTGMGFILLMAAGKQKIKYDSGKKEKELAS